MRDVPVSRPAPPPRDDPGLRANAHSARGAALAGQGLLREAIEEFRAALALVPDNPIARNNLAMTLGRAGAVEGDDNLLAEAAEHLRAALRLQPGATVLYQNLAAVMALGDRAQDAMAALEESLRLDPGNARTRALRSVARLTLGDYERGWDDFDPGLDDLAIRARELPGVPRWRGEALSGTLLINAREQGHGDGIQGLRFAAEARRRVGSIVVLGPPSMARLIARCPGVDRVETSRDRLPAVAAQAVPMHLATVFRPTPATMIGDAYLSADPAAVEKWRPVLEAIPGRRVGLAWQGNPDYHLDACRSFRLAQMEELARVEGVSLVSLQKGPGAEQRASAPFPTVDLGPDYAAGDWLDTAAIVDRLDLVIAPDSAIVHLAGALGRPAWLALPRPADWRWMADRDDSPWYRSVRLFRQERRGDWAPVFRRITAALRDWPDATYYPGN